MLILAQELKPAIQRYATMDKKFPYKLEDDEWEALGVLAGHLKIFYDATLKLSGSKYPTLNLFFPEFCEAESKAVARQRDSGQNPGDRTRLTERRLISGPSCQCGGVS